MDINKVSTYGSQKTAMVQEAELKPAEQTKAASTKPNAGGDTSDRVELSKGYQKIDKLKKVVMEMADIRTERVDQIRNMIQNDTYQVDSGQVAGSILDEVA